jgi:hypothetical protein
MPYPRTGRITNEEVSELISQQSGWAVYVDSLHTVGSPQVIAEGVTANLSNNSNLVINDQIPADATPPLWDSATGKFMPILLNDYYTWIVRFKAKNTSPVGGYMNVSINIGGTFGSIFTSSRSFIRGANVEQDFNITMSGYSGQTFMDNGGLPKVLSASGTTSIYAKEFHIIRLHKGRIVQP